MIPIPSVPPTAVPGSADDVRDATQTVRQFGDAVTQGNDTVALLVLSPSAQQVVAASDLASFLGETTHPQSLKVRHVRLNGDVAIAECTIRSADIERPLHLQLVRLEGVWKIDARVAVVPEGAHHAYHEMYMQSGEVLTA